MTIDPRGQRAGHGMRPRDRRSRRRRPGRGSYERFERRRDPEAAERADRRGRGSLAGVVTIAAVVVRDTVLHDGRSRRRRTLDRRAAGSCTGPGTPREQRADWRTVRVDGSGAAGPRDLAPRARSGTRTGAHILITNDAGRGTGVAAPPRRSWMPDGSHLRPLDAHAEPRPQPGMRRRVTRRDRGSRSRGSVEGDNPELDGIYSDPSLRRRRSHDPRAWARVAPRYSPDGRLLSFFETRAGVARRGRAPFS